jgi:insertion element IS1 protein InsB
MCGVVREGRCRKKGSFYETLAEASFKNGGSPLVYREQATFHTDQYDAYTGVIPVERHRAITKKARKTNHVERFNNTLRQRVSRLVRESLSFSKKLANHVGAIKYFICHYNLTKTTALTV